MFFDIAETRLLYVYSHKCCPVDGVERCSQPVLGCVFRGLARWICHAPPYKKNVPLGCCVSGCLGLKWCRHWCGKAMQLLSGSCSREIIKKHNSSATVPWAGVWWIWAWAWRARTWAWRTWARRVWAGWRRVRARWLSWWWSAWSCRGQVKCQSFLTCYNSLPTKAGAGTLEAE